jgi:hypothetical protein
MYVNILGIIHRPSSLKTQRFRDVICLRPLVNKRRGGGPTRVSVLW